MRRLPVYLVLDTSGSMHGEAIEAVKNGVQTLLTTLRQDPYALETAFISVITFNTSATQIIPLTDLLSFKTPELVATGTTSLGEALSLTADCIEKEVVKTTYDTKGDWRPLVFIMTDGMPTDSNSIKAFFKWVSASISTGSEKVESNREEVIGLEDLPPPPPEVNIVL